MPFHALHLSIPCQYVPGPLLRPTFIQPIPDSKLNQLDATANKMGRWGMRLFEGDRDIDIALDINQAFGADLGLSKIIHQTDMAAGQEIRAYYKTDEYKKQLESMISDRRELLNNGIGDALFDLFRKKEHEPDGKYRVVLVGAIMMRAGATVKDDDFKHLREIVPDIPCRDGLHPLLQASRGRISPLALIGVDMDGQDKGFRHAGKVQFLAALDNYKPGVPRSFQEPRSVLLSTYTITSMLTMTSCYSCGKIAADIGEATISQCSKCKRAWYCNTVSSRMNTFVAVSQGSS